MTKLELDRLLEQTVAEALGVALPSRHKRAQKPRRTDAVAKQTARVLEDA